MYGRCRVAVIIPALDEAGNIGAVVAAIDRTLVDRVIVVDNGSRDDTVGCARAAGAIVEIEPRRGYGAACLRGIAAATDAAILVFLDGDGSDDATEIPLLLDALSQRGADMVIGSRVLGDADPGALTAVQRFGNALTCRLVRWLWGVNYSDLGPFRAITADALRQLRMQDQDFGWTIEMQVKAAQQQLTVVEVPVRRRCRQAGVSKVSGNLRGSFLAGKKILSTVFRSKLAEFF